MGIDLGSIAKIGGGLVGTYFGGPIGSIIGSKVGEVAENMFSGVSSQSQTANNNSNPLNLLSGLTGGQNAATNLLGSALNILA